jgi:hypothetical protein
MNHTIWNSRKALSYANEFASIWAAAEILGEERVIRAYPSRQLRWLQSTRDSIGNLIPDKTSKFRGWKCVLSGVGQDIWPAG